MKRVRIVSDGVTTHVTDAETGEEIEALSVRIEQRGGEYMRVWLEVAADSIDVTGHSTSPCLVTVGA